MYIKEIKDMINLMNENGLTELEIEKEGVRIRLKKGVGDSYEKTVEVSAKEAAKEALIVALDRLDETTEGGLKAVLDAVNALAVQVAAQQPLKRLASPAERSKGKGAGGGRGRGAHPQRAFWRSCRSCATSTGCPLSAAACVWHRAS